MAALFRNQRYLLLRSFCNYARANLFRRPLLRNAELSLTYECNAKCAHCSNVRFVDSSRPGMSWSDIQQVVDQGVRGGALLFTLVGGEPLLSDRLLDTVRYVRCKEAGAIVITNGPLLTHRAARQLR